MSVCRKYLFKDNNIKIFAYILYVIFSNQNNHYEKTKFCSRNPFTIVCKW